MVSRMTVLRANPFQISSVFTEGHSHYEREGRIECKEAHQNNLRKTDPDFFCSNHTVALKPEAVISPKCQSRRRIRIASAHRCIP